MRCCQTYLWVMGSIDDKLSTRYDKRIAALLFIVAKQELLNKRESWQRILAE